MSTYRKWLDHKLKAARADGATEQALAGWVRDLHISEPFCPAVVVPMGFRCTNCGGAVVSAWLYYYGPELHPNQGECGGECLSCGADYTRSTMRGIMKDSAKQWKPKPNPRRKRYTIRYRVVDGELVEMEVAV